VHGGLFVDNTAISRGHRQAILNANATEIGLGAYRTNSYDGYYWTEDYDVQDFGRNGTNHFFTDTLFHDANTNGVYDEGEGVGGIAIRLWDGANEAARFDCSQSSGSMAIPINDLPDGRWIEVRLQNTNAATQRLSIPLGWSTLGEIELTNNEIFSAGYFRQPYGITNLGFRKLEPAVTTSISRTGAQYRWVQRIHPRELPIEYHTNGAGPTRTTLTILTATNEQIPTADPAAHRLFESTGRSLFGIDTAARRPNLPDRTCLMPRECHENRLVDSDPEPTASNVRRLAEIRYVDALGW
jgi:hypothetical protein